MKQTSRDGVLRGGTATLIRLLLFAAACVSAYLLSVSLQGGTVAGCGPGSGCDEVLHSRWAYVLGIPVSALALLVDLTLILATFACGPKSTPRQRRGAWEIILPCSILIFGAALWFVALQVVVLHRICPWCMAAHVCGAVAAVLLLTRVPLGESSGKSRESSTLSRSQMIRLSIIAFAAIAVLGIAQALAPRKTFSVSNVPVAALPVTNSIPPTSAPPKTVSTPATNPPPTPVPATNAVATIQSPTTSSNVLPVLNRFFLDLTQVPLWGSPTAPFKLLSLYDYTCHHCRDMHPRVAEVQRSFGNKLAVVSLPMPLDAQCNYLITRGTPKPHLNACTYAKLGLIVWRAKRDAILEFDDWLFGFQNPPPLSEVTNKAVSLVGLMPFQTASRDPSLDKLIRTSIDIYAVSAKEFHNGNMPQFMMGSNIVTGTLTTEQLRAVVEPYINAASASK
jgi:uncharacterized membrane protein